MATWKYFNLLFQKLLCELLFGVETSENAVNLLTIANLIIKNEKYKILLVRKKSWRSEDWKTLASRSRLRSISFLIFFDHHSANAFLHETFVKNKSLWKCTKPNEFLTELHPRKKFVRWRNGLAHNTYPILRSTWGGRKNMCGNNNIICQLAN